MKKITSVLLLGAVCGFAPAASAVTPADAANLLFLKQEEKVARDVYHVFSPDSQSGDRTLSEHGVRFATLRTAFRLCDQARLR